MLKLSVVVNDYGNLYKGLILVSILILFHNDNQDEVKFLKNQRIFGQTLEFLDLVFLTI